MNMLIVENLATKMPRELNIAPKDFGNDVPSTSTTIPTQDTPQLTQLQLAYRKQRDSVFFGKFPPEIRNRIYVHLLVVDDVIAVEINKWYAAKNWLSWALCRHWISRAVCR